MNDGTGLYVVGTIGRLTYVYDLIFIIVTCPIINEKMYCKTTLDPASIDL